MGKAAYFSYVITLLLIWLEGGFIQAQSCDRGKHWSPEKQTCEKCPVGTYQDNLQDYVPTECKRCPDSTTTFIEGATLKSHCRVDCPLGTEYNFRYHNCSLCPVGEFRNEAVQFCYVCPYGHTTVNSGSSACIKTNSNPPLIQKLNITIALSFNLGPCENINHVTNTVQQNVLFLMRRQRARYPDLCASDNCDNIRVTIQSVCNVSDGARAQIDVININDFLFDNKVEHYRNTLSVLLEAFYDMTTIQDTLANPPICDTGQILKLDGECESCQPGQFANGFQCRNCAKNEYSAKPVNNFCVKCPPNTKTEKEGSSNSSDCKEDDKTVIIAASTSGAVVLCAVIVAVVCWRGCKSRETNMGSQNNVTNLPQRNRNRQVTQNPYIDHMDARQTRERPENQTEYDYSYNLPSTENWDTASQHSYRNPGVIPDYVTSDYVTPDNTLNEEEIYTEIP
ncbi:angiopoietin-related protein 2 [Biomphalaria pfeifferi]|uniref:Angiopoietin-related protein 2 n=1 Tax=Biomphalaria pfeifferi TaxID=112525 RepID=A0AAD8B1A3_BIOPF|nr:angiopoietin-related protein 2 [Biomphalaria pfeifferi]